MTFLCKMHLLKNHPHRIQEFANHINLCYKSPLSSFNYEKLYQEPRITVEDLNLQINNPSKDIFFFTSKESKEDKKERIIATIDLSLSSDLKLFPNYSDTNKFFFVIGMLSVHPTYQNKGLGKELIRSLIFLAQLTHLNHMRTKFNNNDYSEDIIKYTRFFHDKYLFNDINNLNLFNQTLTDKIIEVKRICVQIMDMANPVIQMAKSNGFNTLQETTKYNEKTKDLFKLNLKESISFNLYDQGLYENRLL